MKKTILLLCITIALVACGEKKDATNTNNSTVSTTTEANSKLATITPDYKTLPQYLSCKLDGQPYLAADNFGSITNINMSGRITFATSAEQVKINDETKISEFNFQFFNIETQGAATYISTKDFYVDGHTDFVENGKLKYVSFSIKDGQQITISSYKDGLIEADFAFDVVDEKDPTHILKITDGHLKLQQTGKGATMKVDANGDVDINKVLNDAMKEK